MRIRLAIIALAAVALSGCVSTQFSLVGKDEYRLTKNSDACAVGNPTSLLNFLREEALKFCSGRKEFPVEIASGTEMGIPAIRCTSATLTFRCAPANGNADGVGAK